MWLEGRDQSSGTELAGGLERGRDLGRVMGIVVVDAGPVALTLEFDAPRHPREIAERPRARLGVEAGEREPSEGGERVGDVVAPGHAQDDLGVDVGSLGAEAAATVGGGADLGGQQVGLWSRLARGCLEREPDHPLALLPGEPDVRAGDHCPRRGNEGRERLRELGQRAPARVVIELQVGDRRDLRAQLQEACVALVGLGDDPIALSPAGVGGLAARSSAEQLTAEEEGGVGADAAQRPDAHRRRRRLAVGSRDGQQPALGAELGEELATMDHASARARAP